jgi:hypothetical protein
MNRKTGFALFCAAAAMLCGTPAFACSRTGGAGLAKPDLEMIESNARNMLGRVDAVLEVETLRATSREGPGAVKVLRVIKGDYRRGEVLKAYPSGNAMCGPSAIVPGQRGMIILENKPFSLVEGEKGTLSLPSFLDKNLARAVRRLAVSEPSLTAPLVFDFIGFQKEAQALHERVRNDPDFAGFIIREYPRPRAIVRFTGDAMAHLRRYTTDSRFASQAADLTLAQLETMKDRVAAALQGLGLRCYTVDADEERNQVTAKVSELEKVERAIAEGRLMRSAKVQFHALEACPEYR